MQSILHQILDLFHPPVKARHAAAAHRKGKAAAAAAATRKHATAASRKQADLPPTLWRKFMTPTDINYPLVLIYFGLFATVAFFHPPVFDHARWQPVMDMNRDGQFTVTDLFYWCFWLFYLPGDVVISVLMQMPAPAAFFELDGQSFGGIGSLLMSSLYWWLMGGPGLLMAGLAPIIIQTFLRA